MGSIDGGMSGRVKGFKSPAGGCTVERWRTQGGEGREKGVKLFEEE